MYSFSIASIMLDIDSINERTHAAVAAYHAQDHVTARRLCSEILSAMPTHPYALNLFAVLTMDDGQFEQAIEVFDQLLLAHPGDKQGIGNRIVCEARLRARGDYWLQMGFHYYQTGRIRLAIDIYRTAIAQGAGTDNIHGNLGAHLQELGSWAEAEIEYQQALAKNPQNAGTLYNLGHLLSLQHRLIPAKAYLDCAIAINPKYVHAHLALGHLLAQSGELMASFACFDQATALEPQSLLPPSAKLFNLAYDPRTTAADMYALAQVASGLQYSNALQARHHLTSKKSKLIKIGFVSGDLKDHPVGYFLENLLRHATRERFEWHLFSNFDATDTVAARLRTLATSWNTLAGQSDETAKSFITNKDIDVLIDLSGHTALNRLSLFANRAAPVQISWLGWHDTTGLVNMDYLLTDRASMPPLARPDGSPYVSEVPLYLPRTRLCMMPPESAPGVALQPMLRKGHITFGSMQILAKLSTTSLRLWKRILNEIPTAHLLIRTKQFREVEIMQRFSDKCIAQGLPMERVELLPPLRRSDYLASYADIDILLDTYPYPGGTTTAEALWMGVPTITMGGDTMISRQGVSLLTAAGLEDWIATSEDDYIAKASTWAHKPEQLQALRDGLRQRVAKTALFDGEQFARDFEAAIESVTI